MKTVWLYVESINPPRWGIREGRGKWRIVKAVVIKVTMITAKRKIAPHLILYGKGFVSIVGGTAYLNRKATP